jgi:hypothetical protein
VNTQHAVNAIQHGGTHYQSSIQHWDWVAYCTMDYFSAAASKYVTRWRSKEGVKDLKKASHFVDKARVLFSDRILMPQGCARIPIHEYAAANELNEIETEVCRLLMVWRNAADLDMAQLGIRDLLKAAPDAPTAPTTALDEIPMSAIENEVLPTGWRNYTYEGSVGDKDHYRCKLCRVHFHVTANAAPLRGHVCGAEPTRGYVAQG